MKYGILFIFLNVWGDGVMHKSGEFNESFPNKAECEVTGNTLYSEFIYLYHRDILYHCYEIRDK
jgi:hypothetical protein